MNTVETQKKAAETAGRTDLRDLAMALGKLAEADRETEACKDHDKPISSGRRKQLIALGKLSVLLHAYAEERNISLTGVTVGITNATSRGYLMLRPELPCIDLSDAPDDTI